MRRCMHLVFYWLIDAASPAANSRGTCGSQFYTMWFPCGMICGMINASQHCAHIAVPVPHMRLNWGFWRRWDLTRHFTIQNT